MVVLDKFCFCGRLETGGMVVGILGIIGSLLLIIATTVGLVFFGHVYGQEVQPGSSPEEEEQMKTVHATVLVMIIVMVFLVLSSIGNLIASILLIMGTKKRHPGFVLVWLIASMISIVMFFITFTVDFKIQNLVGAALQIYWWICIYSLYQMLKREKLEPTQMGMNHPVGVGGETKYVAGQGYPQTA